MLVTCTECNTSFAMEERGIKKSGSKVRCSRCKNIFMVYPPEPDSTPVVPEDFEKEIDALEFGSGKKEDIPEQEDLVFDELDKMFGKDDEQAGKGVPESGEKEPEPSDTEDIDFSDLEKMLETGEINLDEMGLEKKDVKTDSGGDAFDLSDLETAIDKTGDEEFEETGEAPEELKLDFEPEKDEMLSKIDDVGELDFSDLEDMDISEETAKPLEKKDMEAEELELDLDLEVAAVETPAGEEPAKAYQETRELDFSDMDKMLEMEETTGEQEKKPAGEVIELKLETDDSSGVEQADRFADAPASGKMELQIPSEEAEQEDVHKHLEGFEIDKFQETKEMGEKEVLAAVADEEEKDKKEVKKEKKSLKIKKPSGRFIITLGIIAALILGGGAFVVYNPLDIEIPFVSDFLGSKADEKGNLKITPLSDSINGDYVDTNFGPLFIIRGNVKNDYKHPRSYIRVIGKLYTKGKKLSKTEMVFCGNSLSEQDIANIEPAVLKKRLQNRAGDKKSNVKVKPGSTIPFVIIYENPSPELDEFTVEAESSMKEQG